jgi:hypothetical protein
LPKLATSIVTYFVKCTHKDTQTNKTGRTNYKPKLNGHRLARNLWPVSYTTVAPDKTSLTNHRNSPVEKEKAHQKQKNGFQNWVMPPEPIAAVHDSVFKAHEGFLGSTLQVQ